MVMVKKNKTADCWSTTGGNFSASYAPLPVLALEVNCTAELSNMSVICRGTGAATC